MKIKKIIPLLTVPFAVILLIVSILIGWLLSYTKADIKDLTSQKDSLEFKREHLSFMHELNELRKTNELYFEKYHLSADRRDDSRKISLISVANATRHPCERGNENGCWKSETNLYIGDVLAVEIHYHNMSPITINNVTLSLSFKKTFHSATLEVVAKSNSEIIQRGIAKIYMRNCNFLELLIGQSTWKIVDSLNYKQVDETNLSADNSNFSVGNLARDAQGSIILRFKTGIEK